MKGRGGPIFIQHKSWQLDNAERHPPSFFPHGYGYEPLKNNDGLGKKVGGWVGGQLGKSAGAELGGMTGPAAPIAVPALSSAGSAIGTSGGEQLGTYVDNASTISDDVQTFLQELSDWNTWANTMQEWDHQ